MLDEYMISRAVDLRKRAATLLQWLDGAISKGFLHYENAHVFLAADPSRLIDWMTIHFDRLPENGRPCRRTREEALLFANMFSTCLRTSFELESASRIKRKTANGCWCPLCAYLTAGTLLKIRKLTPRDKKRAWKLKEQYLRRLALYLSIPLRRPRIDRLIDGEHTRKAVAMATYGEHLLRRMKGFTDGPSALALGRGFAWNDRGSPGEDFALRALDIIKSEQLIASTLGLLRETGAAS